MFIKFFQNQPTQPTQQADRDNNHELALSKAILLTHITAADDKIEPQEWKEITNIMVKRLGIEKDEIEKIKKKAVDKYLQANDINQFCLILKKHLDREKRIQFVEDMLKAAYSDGDISFLEDQAIWKVSELLGVETRERVMLRKKIKENM